MRRINSLFNCVQATIAYKYLKQLEKHTLFLMYFGIKYLPEKSSKIYNNFSENCIWSIGDYFQELCNIKVKREKFTSDSIAKGLKQGYNILIMQDAFFCKWSPAYRDRHISHCMWGIEQKDNYILCDDPYNNMYNQKQFIEDMNNIEVQIIYIPKLDEAYYKIVSKVAVDIFVNIIKHRNLKKIKEQYDKLIFDLQRTQAFEELFESNDPGNCQLILVARHLSNNYKGIYELLKKFDSLYCSEYANKVLELSENWALIFNMLLKNHIKRSICNDGIIDLLRHSCELEMAI